MEGNLQMSDSEKEIMTIIWENGGSIFISDLLKKVEQQNKNWKRTTVRTFLTRLMEKGYITAKRCGRVSEYTAALSEKEYLSLQTKTFVKHMFGGSVKSLLSSLLEQETLEQEEINCLKEFWEKGKEEIK